MIDHEEAQRIAMAHLGDTALAALEIVDGRFARLNVYGLRQPLTTCWVAYVPQPGVALRSSVVVIVSKASGEVLYHGSAFDEG